MRDRLRYFGGSQASAAIARQLAKGKAAPPVCKHASPRMRGIYYVASSNRISYRIKYYRRQMANVAHGASSTTTST